MDLLIVCVPVAAFAALVLALSNALFVRRQSEGTEAMQQISQAIRKGANTYMKVEYRGIGIYFAVVFVLLLILSFFDLIYPLVPFAFLTGGFFSGLAGFIGMRVATVANVRTANACRTSLNKGLKVAFSAGSVMGFVVVGLGLVDITFWYLILRYAVQAEASVMATAMVSFGIGTSSIALFARVGGGIFTKAADVGADLAGKVEIGIPEDDHRNPAVIADNVGDNVGDVAGMGNDLYESYSSSILSAIAMGLMAFSDLKYNAALVPMLIAAGGIIASIIGTLFVRVKPNADGKALLKALRKGTYIAGIISAAIGFVVIYFILGPQSLGVYGAMMFGLLAGILIGFFTEYFTSDNYRPTKDLSESSVTGSATLIIKGLSLGMFSTVLPVIIIGAAIVGSFLISGGTAAEPVKGLYGISIAAVGMLSTLGITLATDAYGPVADNAGGIAEMAQLEPVVRQRTDTLDGLGNTTAATGKGFAIGSAVLTALALLSSYIEQIRAITPQGTLNLNLDNPAILVGAMIGVMLPYLFSAMTMNSVGKAAQNVVVEVRRQFFYEPRILTGEKEPDYVSCVKICTSSALKEMVLPAVIAVVSPILVGFLLGVNGVAGMLFGSILSGFVLANMMSNSGGAWDNAKKYIESGHLGGKGSQDHKAAIVGDTVGDPLKDTSGPSINILMKLLALVSIVFSVIIVKFPSIF